LPHLPPCGETRGIRRGLDQNSCPRGGDLEKVCNRKTIIARSFMAKEGAYTFGGAFRLNI